MKRYKEVSIPKEEESVLKKLRERGEKFYEKHTNRKLRIKKRRPIIA